MPDQSKIIKETEPYLMTGKDEVEFELDLMGKPVKFNVTVGKVERGEEEGGGVGWAVGLKSVKDNPAEESTDTHLLAAPGGYSEVTWYSTPRENIPYFDLTKFIPKVELEEFVPGIKDTALIKMFAANNGVGIVSDHLKMKVKEQK